ncbi:MAG TPA: exosortase/archaeosortase family protein, partial [Opitutaceae bacterium]
LVFIVLLREAFRQDLRSKSNFGETILTALAAVAGLIVFLGANLYAAALEWTHSLVLWLLGVAAALFVWSTLTALAAYRNQRLPAWPTVVSALTWALSAPIPPGTYSRLTQGLQTGISASVLSSLHFLGVAAERIGNVINLAHVTVGVEEACSGVRSLISCLFAALFLSAVIAHRPLTRAALVILSVPVAIGMNFIRSLTLTLLANGGVNIEGFWHDATGYAILAVTTSLLFALARILEPTSLTTTQADVSREARQALDRSKRKFPLAFTNIILLFAVTLWAVFAAKTRSSPSPARAALAPDVASLIPAEAPGWTVSTREDLYQFSSELRTRFLAERSFTRTASGIEQQVTIYIAFWPAGQVPVSLVESHTPDACWPGGGWTEDTKRHRTLALKTETHALPPCEFRSFVLQDYPQNVWYWHLFDGRVIEPTGANSPRQLLSLAWHYGFRKDGDQYFVRVSSNLPWEQIADEPLMHDALNHLRRIGL